MLPIAGLFVSIQAGSAQCSRQHFHLCCGQRTTVSGTATSSLPKRVISTTCMSGTASKKLKKSTMANHQSFKRRSRKLLCTMLPGCWRLLWATTASVSEFILFSTSPTYEPVLAERQWHKPVKIKWRQLHLNTDFTPLHYPFLILKLLQFVPNIGIPRILSYLTKA